MDGCRTIRLERKKGGLGLSIKGGCEHGIPIVVSSIDKASPAASHIHLGDEILSINGISLQGVSHKEAVHQLRTAGGHSVILHIRPNHILEDTFSTNHINYKSIDDVKKDTSHSIDWWEIPDDKDISLPEGWSKKVDHKTGRPYFENHYTKTSTWTDPRSLSPQPLKDFNWESLPPGWERFMDQEGDIYYVNHDTQTTHWDSPRGMREQALLQELREFADEEKAELKKKEDELKEKRVLLLSKNQELEKREKTELNEDADDNNGDLPGSGLSDIIDDIMALNEDAEELENTVQATRLKVQQLNDFLRQAQAEELGDTDQYKTAASLAQDLQRNYIQLKELDTNIHSVITSLEDLRKSQHLDSTPLGYMLQLKPSQDSKEMAEWVHVLGDRLSGKTNIEMRIENCILIGHLSIARQLMDRVNEVYKWIRDTCGVDWERVLDQLVGLEFSVVRDEWMVTDNFREKLTKVTALNKLTNTS